MYVLLMDKNERNRCSIMIRRKSLNTMQKKSGSLFSYIRNNLCNCYVIIQDVLKSELI